MNVAETETLSQMCGVTGLDRIGNEYEIGGSLGVTDAAGKTIEKIDRNGLNAFKGTSNDEIMAKKIGEIRVEAN